MATRDVNIRLSIKDGEIVKRGLMTLGRDGQKALERLEMGAKDASRGLKTLDHTARGTQNAIRGVVGGYVKGLAALYVAQRGLRTALGFAQAAADAEEMRSKFNAVFREASGDVRQWAAETGDAVGRSKLDVESFLATLQDTFVPLGFTRERSAELAKSMAQLSIDVASFNNAADDQTLNAFTSAIVGNHEAVRRFGIVITEARLKQELMSMGLKDGAKNATEQQKLLARLQIIQKSTADAQGDAARTAGTYANRVKAMSGAWKDFSAQLGSFLTENSGPVLDFLNKSLDVVQRIADRFTDIGDRSAETLRRQIDHINKTIEDGQNSTDARFKARIEQMTDDLIKQREELERALVSASKGDRLPTRQQTGAQTKDPVDPEELQRRADKIAAVIAALQFQAAQLDRTSISQEVHNKLQDAGVSLNTRAGKEIAFLVKVIEAKKAAQERENEALEDQKSVLDGIRGPQEDYLRTVEALNSLLDKGAISQAEYTREMREQRIAMLGLATDTGSGFELAMQSIASEAPSAAKIMKDSFEDAADSMEDALADFLTTGKFNYRNFVNDIIKQQARLVANSLVTSGTKYLTESLFANADGNAFIGGRVQAFRDGGVVNRPTLFPMRGGAGLMGEEDPEAILPLKRGRNGRLGVEMNGGGGSVHVTYAPTINSPAPIGTADELAGVLAENNRQFEAALPDMIRNAKERAKI